jgi:hypothetical protein
MADNAPQYQVLADTEFKELNSSIRHYSNLRYLVIPIFLALNGGALLAIRDGLHIALHPPGVVLLVVPLLICGIFYYLETSLNDYIDNLKIRAAKYSVIETGKASFWADIPRTNNRVSYSIRWIYIIATVMLLALLILKAE